MEVFEAIQTRKSCRSYDSRSVPEDILERILEAGRLAPSASNLQPWHFVIVTDADKRKALSAGRYAKFLRDSPVVIVGLGDKERSPDWHVVDVTIALQNMVLAATSEGLGTCWIGSFAENDVKELLGVPENYEVVALLAMGYPREKIGIAARIIGSRSRKAPDEIFSYESYGRGKG